MDGDGESYSDDAGTGIVCAPRHGKSIVLALQRSGWVTPDVCATRARGLVQSRTVARRDVSCKRTGRVPLRPAGAVCSVRFELAARARASTLRSFTDPTGRPLFTTSLGELLTPVPSSKKGPY
jgi:hypothetical protein